MPTALFPDLFRRTSRTAGEAGCGGVQTSPKSQDQNGGVRSHLQHTGLHQSSLSAVPVSGLLNHAESMFSLCSEKRFIQDERYECQMNVR